MKNPELARTYRRIAAEGIDVFYKGAIAREMVDYVRAQGGLWSAGSAPQNANLARASEPGKIGFGV